MKRSPKSYNHKSGLGYGVIRDVKRTRRDGDDRAVVSLWEYYTHTPPAGFDGSLVDRNIWDKLYSKSLTKYMETLNGEGIDLDEYSADDGGADLLNAAAARLNRGCSYSNTAKALIEESFTNRKCDLDQQFMDNSVRVGTSYFHPDIGISNTGGRRKLVAMNTLPRGSMIMVEDSIFTLCTEDDEKCFLEQCDVEDRTLDDIDGPVDVACLIRRATRDVLRYIYTVATSKTHKELLIWCGAGLDGDMTTDLPISDIFSECTDIYTYICPLMDMQSGEQKSGSSLDDIDVDSMKSITTAYLKILVELINAVDITKAPSIYSNIKQNHDMTLYKLFGIFLHNAHITQDLDEQFSSAATAKTRGACLWRSSSYLNHSCAPNLLRINLMNTSIFVCRRTIPNGSELNISYLSVEELFEDTNGRRDLLAAKFICTCTRCNSNSGGVSVKDRTSGLQACYTERKYGRGIKIAKKMFNELTAAFDQIYKDVDDGRTNITYNRQQSEEKLKICFRDLGLSYPQILDENLALGLCHIMRCAILEQKMNTDGHLYALEQLGGKIYNLTKEGVLLRYTLELYGTFYDDIPEGDEQVSEFIEAAINGG